MEDEFESIDETSMMARALPNATAVLVLGILSIVTCIFWGDNWRYFRNYSFDIA